MQGKVPLVCVLVLSMICLSEGNWYGKRGSDVDDAFQSYLEKRITNSALQMNSDREVIYKILQVLQDWQSKHNPKGIRAASFEKK